MAGQSGAFSGAGDAGAGAAGGQGGGDGAGQVDIQALMQDYQQRLGETSGALQQSQEQLQRLQGEHGKTSKIIEGIKKAVLGDDGQQQQADPYEQQISAYEAEIDTYLSAALEAERAGRPIPLTVNSAVKSLQGLIAKTRENQQLAKTVNELKQKVDRVSNPRHQIDSQAFASMDSHILNALNTIYGEGDDLADVKAAQFKAVSDLVTDEIRDLMQNDPKLWDRISRNPVDQRKMVNHFVQQAIPPRARQLLEQEQIRNTPLTMQDLRQAYHEADQRFAKDPGTRDEIKSRLRQQMLEEVWSRNRNRRSGGGEPRPRANDLF